MDGITSALLQASKRLDSASTKTITTNAELKDEHAHKMKNWTIVDDQNNVLSTVSTSQDLDCSLKNPSSLQTTSTFSSGRRGRTVSESQVSNNTNCKVDLSGWLAESENVKELRMARVRRNSNREISEAMSGGLSSADMYMPPV